jgi:hypothetical protein
MNKRDLNNVSVLAIEGYGEVEPLQSNEKDNYLKDDNAIGTVNENSKNIDVDASGGVMFRGKRAWNDSVGGATVCCNQCCSILGAFQ